MENKQLDKVIDDQVVPYAGRPRGVRPCITPVGKNVIYKTDYYIEDGEEKSKPGDELDLVAYLQSSQASTDLANIVARLESGDIRVINVKPQGMTGDLTQLPHSVNDINNLTQKISDISKTNNSYTENSFEDDTFNIGYAFLKSKFQDLNISSIILGLVISAVF